MKNIVNILIILTVVFFSCTKKNNIESTGEVSISNEKIETVNENDDTAIDSLDVIEARRDRRLFVSGEYRSLSDITTIKLYLFKNYIIVRYGSGIHDYYGLSIKGTSSVSADEFILHFDNQPEYILSPDGPPKYAEYFVNFKLLDDNGVYEVNVIGSESDIYYVRSLNNKIFRLEVEYKFSPTHVVIDGDGYGSQFIPGLDEKYMTIYKNDSVGSSEHNRVGICYEVEFIELGKSDGSIQWVKIRVPDYTSPTGFEYCWCDYNMLGKL
jgi:hypothetical protein